jgi:hypothetical protein
LWLVAGVVVVLAGAEEVLGLAVISVGLIAVR